MQRSLPLLLCLAAALVAAAPVSAQSITVFPEPVTVGDRTTLTFGVPVDTLVVTYRPNSAIPIVDTIRVGGFDTVRWSPERAGVVRLSVPSGGASQNVSVRFDEPPIAGIIVLILAALILFGGAAWAMVKLLSKGMPHTMPETRPDT